MFEWLFPKSLTEPKEPEELEPYWPIDVKVYDEELKVNFDGTYEGDLDKAEEILANIKREPGNSQGAVTWLLLRELRRTENDQS